MAGGETDVVDIFVVDTGIFRGHSFHDLSIPPIKKKSQRKFNHQCPWVYSRLHRWFKSNGKVFGGFEKIELLDTIILGKTQSKQATASNNKTTNHGQSVKRAGDTGICPRQRVLMFFVAALVDHAVQNGQQNAGFVFVANQFIRLLERDQFSRSHQRMGGVGERQG